jgi:hypothetical protein
VPVVEANATFQGARPGVEGALGVEILPESPVDIRVLGTVGHYPTGKVLYTHPDPGKDTPEYTLTGAGFALEGGFTW